MEFQLLTTMPVGEDLARKKHVRGGHKASASKMVKKVNDLLAEENPNKSSLKRVKLSLVEKLDVLKLLDAEIVDLVEESELVKEIEGSDEYREGLYAAIVRIDYFLARSTTPTGPLYQVLVLRPASS